MRTALLATAFAALPLVAEAAVIERACAQSARGAGAHSLCGCIQRVADATLSRGDQRLAATFFRDPHRAQEIRQSSRSDHSVFWQRYKRFGATAESYCAR